MAPTTGAPETPGLSTNFVRSVPLFVLAAVFFAVGVVVFFLDPHYGPGLFTLWALLIALGFVSSIGGVASWLLAAEPTASPAPPRAVRTPESTVAAPAREAGVTPRDRLDFGRPSPAVRDRRAVPPYRPTASEFGAPESEGPVWDEEGAREEPPPSVADPADFVSVKDALRDLDGIEEALTPRTRPPPNSAPTR